MLRIDYKEDFIGKKFLCLTEVDYKDLLSRLSTLGFCWVGSKTLIVEDDIVTWQKMRDSTVVSVTSEGVLLVGYYEVRSSGVVVETWGVV